MTTTKLGTLCFLSLICLSLGYMADFPGPYCENRRGGCCDNRKDVCSVPISSNCRRCFFSFSDIILYQFCVSYVQLHCVTVIRSVIELLMEIVVPITKRFVWEHQQLILQQSAYIKGSGSVSLIPRYGTIAICGECFASYFSLLYVKFDLLRKVFFTTHTIMLEGVFVKCTPLHNALSYQL